MKSSAVRCANSSSKGITTSSSTPSPSITSRLTSKGMISFGSASGWRTSSGCGSKVRTVSAPSITARWPRWTPSKVPIATWRGRGSASGSGVTSMSASADPHLAQRLPDGRDQLGDRARRSSSRAGVLDPEGADRGPPQLRAVGVAERLDQGADVGPGRAFDLVVGELAVARRAARPGGPRRRAPASRRPRRGGPSCRGARRRPAPPRSSARRWRTVPVGSSSESGTRPVSVSSPSGSPVLERQPSRAVAR